MYSLSWLALKSFNFLSEIFGFHQLRQRYFERCKFSLFQVYDNFDWLRVTAQAFLISRFLFRPHPIFIQSFTQFLYHLYSPGILRGRRAPRGKLRPTSEQFRTANSIATLPPGISVSLLSSK